MGKSKGGTKKKTSQPPMRKSPSTAPSTTATKTKRAIPHRTDRDRADEDGPSLTSPARHSTKPRPESSTSTSTTTGLPLPFPSHLPIPPNHDFLVAEPPYRESFQVALETSYEGFVVDEHFHRHHETTSIQQRHGGGGGDGGDGGDSTGHNNMSCRITEHQVQTCLEQMQTHGIFQKDITQPFGLGTKCAPTYVTRCLVGNPGTTYKYLGLRMFAHTWWNDSTTPTRCSDHKGSGGTDHPLLGAPTLAAKTQEMTKQIHDLSVCLSNTTKEHLRTLDEKRRLRGAAPTQGRATFDICLINRMDPNEPLKACSEPSSQILPHLGTSVSWHADSSLEHFSTIAVYQTLLRDDGSRLSTSSSSASLALDHPWYVAMRVVPHCEGPTAAHQRKRSIQSTVDVSIPPIAARLPSGSVYYLLDDFNHHHQHTVLRRNSQSATDITTRASTTNTQAAAEPIRYSCTFRLLRDSHTIQYMIQRCQSAVSNFHRKGLKVWRSEQLLLFDVESEWIRQFFIQGSHHYGLLWESYWKDPFSILLKYWSQLEERTHQIIQWLELAARGKCSTMQQQFENDPHQKMTTIPLPSKVERKRKEKEKKAWTTMQGLLDRGGPEEQVTKDNILYETMAEFLEERAKMRELWAKRERDHAFTELAPELRPLPVPFQFVDEGDEISAPRKRLHDMARTDVVARSPLPGQPNSLRAIAKGVRAMGDAFVSGRTNDLPQMIFMTTENKTPHEKPRPHDDQHTKSLIWSGWGQAGTAFGLELQDPWAGAILDGRKAIETRSYDLPPALIGKRIWILESPSGKAGVSVVGNLVDFQDTTNRTCKIVGWCRFGSCIQYTSREQFEADEKRHLVPSSHGGYSWKEGHTRVIYGWVVSDHVRVTATSFVSAVRRMRSLFELKQQQRPQTTGKRKIGSSSKHRESEGQPPNNKKKRY